jgi:hypothetical protein
MNLLKLHFSIVLAAAAVLSASSSEAQPTAGESCSVDRSAMLRLDPNTFDQDDSLGWRKIGNRPECQSEAADLLAAYVQDNRAELDRRWLVPSFKWHEAQLRATGGDMKRAVGLMRESLKPEKGPDGASGWTEFAVPWNEYVKATIAFLNRDKRGLQRARARLAKSPMPAEFAKIDTSQTGGVLPPWPQNLDVVDGLIACFEKPYKEAYGSAECRAAGQKR